MARGEDRREANRAGSSERDQRHRATGGATHLNIPSGVELFTPEPGKTYRMDMSLYKVGKHNPFCRNEGWLYYELTYYIHGRVGPNNEVYCCPSKMRREPCPICEYRAKLENAGPPKGEGRSEWWKREVLPFMPKERQLWLPHVRGNDDEKVMLWDVSHFTFGKLLDQLRKAGSEDEDYKREFDDPKGGACLAVTFTEESGGGFTFTKAVGIEFKSRPKGMNPALLDHGIDLESVPIVASYDDIKRAFYQEEPDDHSEPEKSQPKGRKASEPADDDDFDDEPEKAPPKKSAGKAEKAADVPPKIVVGQKVRHRKLGVCEVLKVSGDGTSLVLEDEDGNPHKAQDAKDVRPIEDEPKPKAKASKSVPPPDDDDDDGWDNEPKPSGKAKSKPAARDEDDWDDDEPNDDPKPARGKQKKAVKEDEDDGWD